MPSLRGDGMTQLPMPMDDGDQAPGHARELRRAWLGRRRVMVTLSEHCAIPLIVGRVASVSVTGATAVIDGWVIPVEEVESISPATNADADVYADSMHVMREQEVRR